MPSPLNERQRGALLALHALEGVQAGAFTAETVAHRMGLDGARRSGNGATQGSWSGRCAPGLHLAATMRALKRRGLVYESSANRSRYVGAYRLTPSGRRAAEKLA